MTLTKLGIAATDKDTLRTTIPHHIVEQFNLKKGDYIDWKLEHTKKDIRIYIEVKE